jgi:hypothetical protein
VSEVVNAKVLEHARLGGGPLAFGDALQLVGGKDERLVGCGGHTVEAYRGEGMSGTNVKTWTADELQQLVGCELDEAQAAITALGAKASKDDLVRKVLAIRRAKALTLAARKLVAEATAKSAAESASFDEEPDSGASVPRP